MDKNIVAIIPARGNSKRIKNKNLYPIHKKPLIYYSIIQAMRSTKIKEVYVSSDDTNILNFANSLNCKTIKRPKILSKDTSTSEDALLHALNKIEKYYEVDAIMLLQCTSPVRKSEDLDDSIDLFYKKNADSLFSVVPFHRFVWSLNKDKLKSINFDFRNRPRSQDFQNKYLETGSLYITKTNILKNLNNRLGGKIIPFVMDFITNFEIDTLDDVKLVEWAIKNYNK